MLIMRVGSELVLLFAQGSIKSSSTKMSRSSSLIIPRRASFVRNASAFSIEEVAKRIASRVRIE